MMLIMQRIIHTIPFLTILIITISIITIIPQQQQNHQVDATNNGGVLLQNHIYNGEKHKLIPNEFILVYNNEMIGDTKRDVLSTTVDILGGSARNDEVVTDVFTNVYKGALIKRLGTKQLQLLLNDDRVKYTEPVCFIKSTKCI